MLVGSWELIESDCKDEHLTMNITKSIPQIKFDRVLRWMCVEWEPCCIVLVELVRYGVRTSQPRSIGVRYPNLFSD